MIAFKGFNKNLTCTMGRGVFQYEQGVWYTEEQAHCARNGFHATDNPLDVLAYYNKEDDRYFIVEVRGNIDEDGVNSRISAPEIKLMKELTKDELYEQGVIWMSQHSKAPWARVVMKETGDAKESENIIVRGKNPKAKGKHGSNLYIVKEDKNGEIIEIGAFRVDGKTYVANTYYNVKGVAVRDQKRA